MLKKIMPAAQEAGYSTCAYRQDTKVIADTFIQVADRYEYYGIVVDVDTAVLADAVGVLV